MEKMTVIYVLFREYSDVQHAPSAPFIHGVTFPLGEEEQLSAELENIFDVLDFFKYEHAHVLYDEDNIKGLLYQADEMPEEYPSLENVFTSQLPEHGMISWQECAAERDDSFSFQDTDVADHLLGDMSQRVKNDDCEPSVLLQQGAIDTIAGHVGIDMPGKRKLKLRSVNNIQQLHKWLSDNRYPKRQYVFNPKHGDANHSAGKITDRHGTHSAAHLLTDEHDTQLLLNKAIGSSQDSALWYFDHTNNCYIYFENQKEIRLAFHGYHLHKGDKNFDKIDFEKLRKIGL